MAESSRCLQCTCEAIGFCDLRRLGIEYGTTLQTLEPDYHQGAGYRSVTENRFTGVNHDYIRDDSHAFILREPSRCIDCGRCAQVCAEVVGAACSYSIPKRRRSQKLIASQVHWRQRVDSATASAGVYGERTRRSSGCVPRPPWLASGGAPP